MLGRGWRAGVDFDDPRRARHLERDEQRASESGSATLLRTRCPRGDVTEVGGVQVLHDVDDAGFVMSYIMIPPVVRIAPSPKSFTRSSSPQQA
jgi:hypothetical protein